MLNASFNATSNVRSEHAAHSFQRWRARSLTACFSSFTSAGRFGINALTILVVVAGSVAGCGRAADVARVTIWHQKIGPERDFFEQVVSEYNAAHTDREVVTLYRENEELRNLFVVASVGGKGPDLVFGPSDNVSILAVTGTIRPVTDVLEPSFLADFNNDGIVRWDDDAWMIADQVGNHLTFVYNKQLLPNPPQTISEMVRVLDSLTVDTDGDGKTDRYGLTWNYTEPFFFIPFLTGFGGWMMDENGAPTLNTEATVKAIEFVLKLRDQYGIIPPSTDYDTSDTLFKEGRAAAIINGPWSWAGYAKSGIDYGLSRIPLMDETGLWCAPVISAKGYSVNVNVSDEKIPLVRDVLHFLTNADMQTRMAIELATIPVIDAVRDDAAVQANPILQASLRQVEVGKPMPTSPQLRQVWDGMRGPYQLVMNGAVSAEEGARLMQREVEKRIADAFL